EEMTCGSRFSHEMRENAIAEIEVTIHLGAAVLWVGWESGPDNFLPPLPLSPHKLAAPFSPPRRVFLGPLPICPGFGGGGDPRPPHHGSSTPPGRKNAPGNSEGKTSRHCARPCFQMSPCAFRRRRRRNLAGQC